LPSRSSATDLVILTILVASFITHQVFTFKLPSATHHALPPWH
jgi:hypothetical protein